MDAAHETKDRTSLPVLPDCGIRVFATGEEKDLGGKFYAVAIAALDDVEEDVDQLAMSITFVDGRHDRYGKGAPPPADTRLM